jgi:anti-sigma factor RsiW
MNPHAEAQDLLPWLANGTLSGTELERVQAHVKACAACRADLATLHTLRAAGTAAAPAFDPDAALARLLPQLETPAEIRAETLPDMSAPAAPLPAARGWRARLAANDARWLRAAVALQCGVITVLAVLLARPQGEGDAGAYRVLGAQPAVQGALVVAFKPDTPERELRRIVLDSGAHIVGGPTVTGAWMLGTAGPPAEVAARLRAQGAVTLAEPLGAQDRP